MGEGNSQLSPEISLFFVREIHGLAELPLHQKSSRSEEFPTFHIFFAFTGSSVGSMCLQKLLCSLLQLLLAVLLPLQYNSIP